MTQPYSSTEAIKWGNLVQIAYDMYSADPHNPDPLPPEFPNNDWRVLGNLVVDSKILCFSEKEFMGFVVESTVDPSQVGIVFRGTVAFMDWLDDLEFKMVPFTDVAGGGHVEDGFVSLYNSIAVMQPGQTETQTMSEFCATALQNRSLVTVTGHSLGGALANIAGIVLASQQPSLKLQLYTFAAPMTGDQTFVTLFDQLVPSSYRIYNKPDIVPTVPSVHLGYEQVNIGIQINSLQYPAIAKSIPSYHKLATYLYVLQQQQPATT